MPTEEGPATAGAPQVTTIRGKLRGTPLKLVARSLRSGRLTGTLAAPRARKLALTLLDARGKRVSRVSGRSPLKLSHLASAGRYRFTVTGTRGARFTLRIRSGAS